MAKPRYIKWNRSAWCWTHTEGKIKMPGFKVQHEYFVMDGYEVSSYYSTEDEVFVAQIEQLPGCAAEGVDRDASLAALRDFKAEWIREMQEMGKEIPSPKFVPGRVLA